MTDTGQVPGEGLPENAGGQPGLPPHSAYAYPEQQSAHDVHGVHAPHAAAQYPGGQDVHGVPVPHGAQEYYGGPDAGLGQDLHLGQDPVPGHPLPDTGGFEDDQLLMPGAQGAWMDQPSQPLQQPLHPQYHQHDVPPAAHGEHLTAGQEHDAAAEYAAVTGQAAAPEQAPAPARRPLHMGPPVPDAPTGGVVRSLADRGPAAAPQPEQSPAGGRIEYLDMGAVESAEPLPGPQLGELPPPAEAWTAEPRTAPGAPESGPADGLPHAAVPDQPFAAGQAPAEGVPGALPPAEAVPAGGMEWGAPAGAGAGALPDERPHPGAVTDGPYEPGPVLEAPQGPVAYVPAQATAEPAGTAGEPAPVQPGAAQPVSGAAEPRPVQVPAQGGAPEPRPAGPSGADAPSAEAPADGGPVTGDAVPGDAAVEQPAGPVAAEPVPPVGTNGPRADAGGSIDTLSTDRAAAAAPSEPATAESAEAPAAPEAVAPAAPVPAEETTGPRTVASGGGAEPRPATGAAGEPPVADPAEAAAGAADAPAASGQPAPAAPGANEPAGTEPVAAEPVAAETAVPAPAGSEPAVTGQPDDEPSLDAGPAGAETAEPETAAEPAESAAVGETAPETAAGPSAGDSAGVSPAGSGAAPAATEAAGATGPGGDVGTGTDAAGTDAETTGSAPGTGAGTDAASGTELRDGAPAADAAAGAAPDTGHAPADPGAAGSEAAGQPPAATAPAAPAEEDRQPVTAAENGAPPAAPAPATAEGPQPPPAADGAEPAPAAAEPVATPENGAVPVDTADRTAGAENPAPAAQDPQETADQAAPAERPASAPAPDGPDAAAPEPGPEPEPEPVAAAPAEAPAAPAEAEAPAADPAGTDPAAEEAADGGAPTAAGEVPAEEPAAAPAVPATPPAEGYGEAERAAVHRVMRERRDIRNGFRPDPIPHEVLLRVLEAAHTAPSVGHSQPWDFVVIRSEETRRAMHELADRQREAYAKSLPKGRAKQFKQLKIEAILDTPVNIVVTADPTRGGRHTLGRHTQPQMAPYSSALAVENLWLAARAEGLGVGWVSFFDEREMVRALGLPEHLEVVAYLCVGYVDEFPDEPELMQAGWAKRRPLSWVVHEETYGRRALPGEEPHDLLQETLRRIRPLDAKALGEAWERQKRMTKPSGALGMLEIISAQLSGLSRQCPPPIPEPAAVAIFAGDHGVHAQGVTAWPQEVTSQMVANFLGGGAVCNAFANQVGAEVCVIDVGVVGDLPATPGLLPRKVRAGTDDFTAGPAMSREEVLRAIEVGIETARDLVAAGNKALLTGEMGIANTTVSAALISVYTDADPAEITGRGTGINDEMHARKVDVVRRALELHQPDPADPIGVLAAIGGLEHAAIVGLVLGGASLRTPVILDGVSAGAAALVARAIAPEALAACIAGHRSAEPGHVAALNKLGLRPLVDLDLRLGEGTGALLALPVVQSAARAMHEVATFDAAGVTEKS
ncbi:nicotinate-nucleotide--dimethylbenzimidazole phosphoribosyltransferase [Streptomyces sp. NPDC018031]|uniref:nicotinate-nucleotide--dimethylbenzimidazole phosphoribosyltransferase n=1 Tax=Streptomyces sp. NPDC018031 TaxID=3365033 RepID=UPI0037ABCFF5